MACKLSDLAERNDPSYMDEKRAASQDEFVLERVQGLTNTSLHALASNPMTGWVAFPAACVLVLLDPKTNEQKFIESPSLRNIACCAFTDDGRFVAFGETGMKPHIAIWNLREHKECYKFVTDMTVRAIFFHPTSQIIISLAQKESSIVVWDYVKGMRMASCKWQTMPLALTVPRVGSSLVVCGHRKITLFNISKVDSHSHETNVFEDRKTVLLGKQSEYTFVDIESGRGKHERTVYTVTSCGYLCEVKLGDILIDKAIKVDTQTFCVRYNTELLFVGCTAGVVKICDPDNLTVTAAVSLSSLLGPKAMPLVGNKAYLDVCTLVVDENEKIVTCVYADCSMHSWQIGTDGEKIVCSAIEPGAGGSGASGHPASKSNLLRAFIGCCEKSKGNSDFLSKFSVTEQNKPPVHFGGRRLVNENRVSYQNVNAVRFTPDGKDVICGNEEGEIKVYELSTGILRRVIEAHSSQVTCIEVMYDDDFQLVCSGGRDRVMFVLNARTDFSLVQVLCDHSAAITAISLVNNKGVLTLVSAAADNVILIRRAILGGTLRFTITGEIAQTNCNRSFFVTSDYIALGGKDSQIKVFKADPVFVSKPVKTINCQKLNPASSGFKAIDIDPSSSFMAVSQANGNISVYHLQTGQPVASLPLQSDIAKIQFTDDLKYMVSSTATGCDLVWRLPERMTEFMRTKQKTYQVETNKEVTYETYMSCVKVCKEDDDDDDSSDQAYKRQTRKHEKRHLHHRRGSSESRHQSRDRTPHDHRGHIAQNSSNHNSEWDRTPSIDSMSMLDNYSNRVYRAGKSGSRGARRDDKNRGCSTCGSDVIVSCSTCTHSMSTTTHTSCCSAVASDSSASTHAGQTRDGQPLRFYCGADHKLFGQVIEEGTCVKVGPFKEAAAAGSKVTVSKQASGPMVGVRPKPSRETNGDQIPNAKKIPSLESNKTPVANSLMETVKQSDEQKNVQHYAVTITPKPIGQDCAKKTVSNNNDAVSRSLKEPSDVAKGYSDNLDTLDFCHLSLQRPQNMSQNSDQCVLMSPNVPEARQRRSKKILEKAIFYENVMKGDLKSSRWTSLSSPTRQDTAAVKEAIQIQRDAPDLAAAGEGAGEALYKDQEERELMPPNNWTPLTTPDYSNTSSNITNLVPSSSSTLVDVCNSIKLLQETDITARKDESSEKVARAPRCSPASNQSEEGTLVGTEVKVVQPCSDTTQEESFRTELAEVDHLDGVTDDLGLHEQVATAADKSTYVGEAGEEGDISKSPSLMEKLVPRVDLLPQRQQESYSIYETNNMSENDGDECQLKPETAGGSAGVDEQPKIQVNSENIAKTGHATEPPEGKGESKAELSLLEQLAKEGLTIPEKYHCALRDCMQLSNSQETFATLPIDINDRELMAFLSKALKKKMVAADLVGLSCTEIEELLQEGITPSVSSPTAVKSSQEIKAQVAAQVTPSCGEDVEGEQSGREKACAPKDVQIVLVGNGTNDTRPDKVIGEQKKHVDNVAHPAESEHFTCFEKPKLSRSNSPEGKKKKGVYKSIIDRLSFARKNMTNKSANRSGAGSEQLDDHTLQLDMKEITEDIACLDLREHDGPVRLDTHLSMETSEERSMCFRVAKNGIVAADVTTDPESPRVSNTLALETPSAATVVKPTPMPARPASCNSLFEKGTQKATSDTKRSSSPSATTESPDANVKAAPAPWQEQRFSEGRGHTILQEDVKSSRCFSPSQPAWKLSASTTCQRESRESVHSKAESFDSILSKDVSMHQSSESDSGVEAERQREKPMADIFRDQDEYLRKLKEVRENFERSIQALSAERKSRQATEDRGKNLAGK